MSRVKEIKKESIDADKAFDVHKLICERELARRALLVDNIVDITEKMFGEQLYKPLLGSDPNPVWSGYLGLVEIYYSRSQVERYRKIYNFFFKKHGFKMIEVLAVPDSRLDQIVIANSKDKEKVIELIEQAKILDSRQWRDAVAEAQGKPTSDDCKHNMRVEERCTKCGTAHVIQVPKENESNSQKI